MSRRDFSHNRFGFFLNTLKNLKCELKKRGGDLLVLDSLPHTGFAKLLKDLSKTKFGLPKTLSFNRDYEPFSVKRDLEIAKILQDDYPSIELYTDRDHLILEPHEVKKSDGGYYKVYTPFSRAWISVFKTKFVQERIESSTEFMRTNDKIFSLKWNQVLENDSKYHDKLESFISKNEKEVTVPLPDAGFDVAHQKLLAFRPKLKNYEKNRNIPSIDGTSRLSIYLKNGSITTAQIFKILKPDSNSQFTKELIWREFYYHILAHEPRVENEAFLKQYKNLNWDNNKDYFKAWTEGKTGFPIVDAGMRQLKQTGWMHNRVRMIVASFLTKDLLIDWRLGEEWFMKYLLDGDLAANNGGWQWAASTGCDAQPYFRIFNPALQSKRFDPDGTYIKQFVPELKNLSAKEIHEPNDENRPKNYPMPIVNHDEQRKLALRLYKR